MYDAAHLGHARTYVCTDIIRRILTDNFKVNLNFAMGMTDIDDKIIDKARAKGLHSVSEVSTMTRQLERDFFRDMDRLNVLRPDAVLRVTEHIDEIIAYVARLIDLGHAYVSEDGVYYSMSTLKGTLDKFGVLGSSENASSNDNSSSSNCSNSSNSIELVDSDLVAEAWAEEKPSHAKRDQRDFALWKLAAAISDASAAAIDRGGPVWDSPWGAGRPGWHIECSAMTHAYFGPHIDVHSGGVDLKFPHHTNEIVQW